jgi:hypothetical protein
MDLPLLYASNWETCPLTIRINGLIYGHVSQGYWPRILNDGD